MGTLDNCGPSTAVQNDAAQAQSFSNLLSSNYQQQFQAQSNILSGLNNQLSPIVAAGPNQQGFSPAELSALNASAVNTTGAAYKNAAQATAGALAGHASDSGLESGVQQQIKASLASASAGQEANTENQIQQANYATGRSNFFNAVSGSQALASAYNPTAYGGEAISSQNNAFNQNLNVEEQNNAMSAGIIGGITSLAGDAATFGTSGLAGGGSLGGGFGGFLKAGANGLGANFGPPSSGGSGWGANYGG